MSICEIPGILINCHSAHLSSEEQDFSKHGSLSICVRITRRSYQKCRFQRPVPRANEPDLLDAALFTKLSVDSKAHLTLRTTPLGSQ